MGRPNGKIAISKVNDRLKDTEMEAYKFRRWVVEEEACILCNRVVNGEMYRVSLRLKGTRSRLRRFVMVCRECAKCQK